MPDSIASATPAAAHQLIVAVLMTWPIEAMVLIAPTWGLRSRSILGAVTSLSARRTDSEPIRITHESRMVAMSNPFAF